jgi:hypothetical protein
MEKEGKIRASAEVPGGGCTSQYYHECDEGGKKKTPHAVPPGTARETRHREGKGTEGGRNSVT